MGISDVCVIPVTITCTLQGVNCDTGIPHTFYGGNICSVDISKNQWRSTGGRPCQEQFIVPCLHFRHFSARIQSRKNKVEELQTDHQKSRLPNLLFINHLNENSSFYIFLLQTTIWSYRDTFFLETFKNRIPFLRIQS